MAVHSFLPIKMCHLSRKRFSDPVFNGRAQFSSYKNVSPFQKPIQYLIAVHSFLPIKMLAIPRKGFSDPVFNGRAQFSSYKNVGHSQKAFFRSSICWPCTVFFL